MIYRIGGPFIPAAVITLLIIIAIVASLIVNQDVFNE